MGGSEARDLEKRNKRKRKHNGHSDTNGSNVSSDADSASVASQSNKKGSRKRKHREEQRRHVSDAQESSHDTTTVNGTDVSTALANRRPSLTQPARDPRDITTTPTKRPRVNANADSSKSEGIGPYIDFDGLSRPSTWGPSFRSSSSSSSQFSSSLLSGERS